MALAVQRFFQLLHASQDSPGGADTVADFTDGQGRIDLTALGLRGFAAVNATAVAVGVRLDLTDEGGGTVLLRGVDLADLDAGDFLF